jgi:hypothetical protein
MTTIRKFEFHAALCKRGASDDRAAAPLAVPCAAADAALA